MHYVYRINGNRKRMQKFKKRKKRTSERAKEKIKRKQREKNDTENERKVNSSDRATRGYRISFIWSYVLTSQMREKEETSELINRSLLCFFLRPAIQWNSAMWKFDGYARSRENHRIANPKRLATYLSIGILPSLWFGIEFPQFQFLFLASHWYRFVRVSTQNHRFALIFLSVFFSNNKQLSL